MAPIWICFHHMCGTLEALSLRVSSLGLWESICERKPGWRVMKLDPVVELLKIKIMKVELIVRGFAGAVVLASLGLAHFVNSNWLWLAAFVGFNLLQSSLTRFCPLELLLVKMGVGGCCQKKEGKSQCS